ncbi:MAG: ATP-binding cassette domain-containing protein [Bdellovibrionota bacterium]
MKQNILDVRNLTVRFGGIVALDKVNFGVEKGSITALIGPNGAGKTTVFNCLTGFYKSTEGSIDFGVEGKRINIEKVLGEPFELSDCLKPSSFVHKLYYKTLGGSHLVARAGLARTFQNIRLFDEMTAIENLMVAQHMNARSGLISGLLNLPGYRASEQEHIDRAYQWLDIIDLTKDANRLASELPYGHQRRLEIARAMCIDPKMICLDEPAAGLNPAETEDLARLIQRLRDEYHVTVFVIEHDMALVMDISDQIVVLNYGQVIAHGEPEKIKNDPTVLAAYLGTEES